MLTEAHRWIGFGRKVGDSPYGRMRDLSVTNQPGIFVFR